MKIIRFLFITVFLLSIMNNVYSRTLKNRFTGMGYVTIGQHYLNITDFKSRLASSSIKYPEPLEYQYAFGGGGLFLIGKYVIAFEGVGLSTTQESNNGYKSKLDGGFVKLETGYLLFENKLFHIFPLVGVGSNLFNYKINKDTRNVSFEDLINNPQTGTSMSTNNFFINAALGIDYNINMRGSEIEEANFVIGLRLGYNFSMVEKEWKINETSTNLSNGPGIGLEGPYFNIILGISGSNFEDEE